MAIKVLVTSTSFGKVIKEPVELLNKKGYQIVWNELGRPLKEEEVVERVKEVDAYIAGLDEITARAIEAGDKLKVISKYGAGIDNLSTKKGEWKKFFGSAVYGKTLGIVGMGEIGKAVARRAKGFNMQIIYWSRRRKSDIEEEVGAKYTDLKSLLQEADFVSLHLALTGETKNIIGEDEIKLW